MSQVPIMVTGVLWDHATKSGRAVTLMGEAHLVDVGVGGGPVYPPSGPPGQPTHPIVPPGGYPHPDPGPVPPGGYPGPGHPIVPPGGYPHPEHPIVYPPDQQPPDQPPTGPLGQVEWHTIWTPVTGWAIVGIPAGEHVTPSKK